MEKWIIPLVLVISHFLFWLSSLSEMSTQNSIFQENDFHKYRLLSEINGYNKMNTSILRHPSSVKEKISFAFLLNLVLLGNIVQMLPVTFLKYQYRQLNKIKQTSGGKNIRSLRKTGLFDFLLPSVPHYFNVYGFGEMFAELLSPTISDLSLMRYEWLRYETYKNYPPDGPSTPSKLAANGFYYTCRGNMVKCYSCNVTNGIWPETETIAQTHRRISPACMFARCNVPIRERNNDNGPTGYIQPDKCRYPEFINKTRRELSFKTWPDENIFHREFAAAGFFYTKKDDLVRCYACGIGFKDWSADDDPWVEHFRHSHACLHLHESSLSRSQSTDSDNQQHTTCGERYHEYKEIDARLASFKRFPLKDKISPVKMAFAGLFFTGNGDLCRCFSCGGGLKYWLVGDDPVEEHAHYFPHCRYISSFREKESNENKQDEQLQNSKKNKSSNVIRFPQYQDIERRLESFKTFPHKDKISVVEMAAAGLYYTGNEDACRCFTCGGGMFNWEAGDDPRIEHELSFPECDFVNLLKRTDITTAIHDRRSTNENEGTRNESQSSGTLETATDDIDNSVVQLLTSMGYSEAFVKSAFENISQNRGNREISAEIVLEYLLDIEPDLICATNAENVMPRNTVDFLSGSNHDQGQVDTGDEELQQENQRIEDKTLCKICFQHEVNILFLPCAHHAVCSTCCEIGNFTKCVICRADIRHKVRTYTA